MNKIAQILLLLIDSFNYQLANKGASEKTDDWAHTIKAKIPITMDGEIWTVEGDTLYRTRMRSKRREQVGPQGILKDITLIVAVDGVLYVVENGTLYLSKR